MTDTVSGVDEQIKKALRELVARDWGVVHELWTERGQLLEELTKSASDVGDLTSQQDVTYEAAVVPGSPHEVQIKCAAAGTGNVAVANPPIVYLTFGMNDDTPTERLEALIQTRLARSTPDANNREHWRNWARDYVEKTSYTPPMTAPASSDARSTLLAESRVQWSDKDSDFKTFKDEVARTVQDHAALVDAVVAVVRQAKAAEPKDAETEP